MDLDKIISAWEHCTSDEGDCDDCPYNNDFNGCMLNLKLDTIKVLKFYKEHEHDVCENCPYKLEDIGDFSDGYHTFNDLYTQRAVLFATIVNQNLDKAWKSHKHEDGEPCFGGGWFIVAVDTPKGSYSYHYEDKYWDIFKCVELPVAKHWDGHTDKDVWRLLLLT